VAAATAAGAGAVVVVDDEVAKPAPPARAWSLGDAWYLKEHHAELLELLRRGSFGPPRPYGKKATVPSLVGREGYRAAAAGEPGVATSEAFADLYVPIGGHTWLCLLPGCLSRFVAMSAYKPEDPTSGVRFDNFKQHLNAHHAEFVEVAVLQAEAEKAARAPMPKTFASFVPGPRSQAKISFGGGGEGGGAQLQQGRARGGGRGGGSRGGGGRRHHGRGARRDRRL